MKLFRAESRDQKKFCFLPWSPIRLDQSALRTCALMKVLCLILLPAYCAAPADEVGCEHFRSLGVYLVGPLILSEAFSIWLLFLNGEEAGSSIHHSLYLQVGGCPGPCLDPGY